jgi:hypothetical protein
MTKGKTASAVENKIQDHCKKEKVSLEEMLAKGRGLNQIRQDVPGLADYWAEKGKKITNIINRIRKDFAAKTPTCDSVNTDGNPSPNNIPPTPPTAQGINVHQPHMNIHGGQVTIAGQVTINHHHHHSASKAEAGSSQQESAANEGCTRHLQAYSREEGTWWHHRLDILAWNQERAI